jgi:hypothetical protein
MNEWRKEGRKEGRKEYCTVRGIFLSESHDHRWAKTIEEGGPLLSMSSIKLGLLNENDELNKVELF